MTQQISHISRKIVEGIPGRYIVKSLTDIGAKKMLDAVWGMQTSDKQKFEFYKNNPQHFSIEIG